MVTYVKISLQTVNRTDLAGEHIKLRRRRRRLLPEKLLMLISLWGSQRFYKCFSSRVVWDFVHVYGLSKARSQAKRNLFQGPTTFDMKMGTNVLLPLIRMLVSK